MVTDVNSLITIQRSRIAATAVIAIATTVATLTVRADDNPTVATVAGIAAGQVRALEGPSTAAAGPSDVSKASVKASGDVSAASTQITHAWPVQSANGLIVGRVQAAAPFSDSSTPKADLGSVSALTAGVNARVDANFLWVTSNDENKAVVKRFQDSLDALCDQFIEDVVGSPYYFKPIIGGAAPDPRPIIYAADQQIPLSGQNSHSCGELLTLPAAMKELLSQFNDAIKKRNEPRTARNKAREKENAQRDKRNAALPAGKSLEEKEALEPLEPELKLLPGWQERATAAFRRMTHVESARFSLLQSVGLSFLGNQHSYSYVTAAAPSKILKQSDEGYGIGLNYTALLTNMSIIIGYSYERPFKAGQGQQICSPVGTSTSTTCSSAAVGAPVRTTAHIASLETRILFGSSLALGPRVEYDTVAANLGVKLPVYFVADTDKILTGGIEVGWTKNGGYQGAVVIEKAFSFLD